MPYDEDHEAQRRAGDCIHFVPRLQCRICPPIDRTLPAPYCPAPACGEGLTFGQFKAHRDHAPLSVLFRRRESARLGRLALARRRSSTYPPYMLFDDRVLDTFATHWPTSASIFLGYFGATAWDWWGRDLLELLDSDPAPRPPDPASLTSIDVFRYLLSGVDPFTGEVIGRDSLLAHPGIASAMREAVAALGKRKLAPRAANQGTPWSDEDHAALIEAFEAGAAVEVLAAQLGRTPLAIRSRLVKYGYLSPDAVNGEIPNAPPKPAADQVQAR